MNLADILVLLLSCCGATFIVVHAEILTILGIRQLLHRNSFFKKLTKCSLCTGFWIGFLTALFWIPLKYTIPFCFASSAICFFFDRIIILLDELVIKLEHEPNRKHTE